MNSIYLIGTNDTFALTNEQLTGDYNSYKVLILQEMLNEEVNMKKSTFPRRYDVSYPLLRT